MLCVFTLVCPGYVMCDLACVPGLRDVLPRLCAWDTSCVTMPVCLGYVMCDRACVPGIRDV